MMWLFYAFGAAIAAALATIFNKLLVQRTDPLVGMFVRSIIISISFLLFVIASRKKLIAECCLLDMRSWGVLLVSAIAGALTLIFNFGALKIGPTSQVAAISKTSTVFVMILATSFLQESVTLNGIIGVVLVVVGLVVMSF